MDSEIRQTLRLMTSKRLGDAGIEAREKQEAITADLYRRGVFHSGFGQMALVKTRIEAFSSGATGTLVDYLSVAHDVRADASLLTELEQSYVHSVEEMAKGLKRAVENMLAGTWANLRPSALDEVQSAANRLIRDAKVAFQRERLRNRTVPAATRAAPSVRQHRSDEQRDFFLSHAGEDRKDFVSPLAEELVRRKHSVWFSEYEITLGDSLRANIDRGLADSRFGIVVLSPSFFAKPWPRAELDALAARAANEDRKVILPVRHRLSIADLQSWSPTLAGVHSADSSIGISAVADEVIRALTVELQRKR